MIDEPKTLKDLKHQEGSLFIKDRHISEKELKAEAIKIHKLADDHYKFNREMPFMASWDRERKFLQEFLRWQYNLTEDDLK